MGTLKGQHLRLLLNDKCVAAAQSCAVHISMQMESSSSKDSTGDWDEQEPVGLNWDVSTDALVVDGIYESGQVKVAQEAEVGAERLAYMNATGIKLAAGRGIDVSGGGESADNLVLEKMGGSSYKIVSTAGKYVNTGAAEVTVYVACFTEGTTLTYVVYDGNAFMLDDVFALKGEKVTVKFATTTGEKNREVVDELMEGVAIVSDIQVTAANRANSTFSVQLAGDGELKM